MGSLLKYKDESEGRVRGNEQLLFGRSKLDGMPYRGPQLPLREEEYEELTEVVCDSFVETFDLSNPEHKQQYQGIVERVANGWFCIHENMTKMVKQPDGSVKVFVHCVWSVPVRELDRSRAEGILPT